MYILFGIFILVLLVVAKPIYNELKFRQERRKNPIPASHKSGPFFDSTFRKLLQPPTLMMKRSGIEAGMIVLDLGCGSGAYATEAARIVGDKGLVYASDLQNQMLNQVRSKLKRAEYKNLNNIKLVQADAANKLPFNSNSFDLIFMIDVLQEIPNHKKTLKELYRILKPTGILAISEYFMDPDFVFKSQTVNECEAAGFVKQLVFGNPLHYTIRFTKN